MNNGLGTPFLNIYDNRGNVLLDRILVNDGSYRPIAIDNFTYTFCETEDDTGSITLISNSPEFMDKINLVHYQKIYLEWGWLGGARRKRLAVVVRNLKESYTVDGYKLILEISDKLAATKTAKSSVVAKLEEIKANLSGQSKASEEKLKDFDNFASPPDLPILNPEDLQRGYWGYGQLPLDVNNMPTKNGYSPSPILSIPMERDYFGPEPVKPPAGASLLEVSEWAEKHKQWEETGKAMQGFYETGDELQRTSWAKLEELRLMKARGEEPEEEEPFTGGAVEPKVEGLDEKGNPIYATGDNGSGVIQNYMDKTQDEPTAVTGAGDDIKIIKRKQQAMEPPKDKYFFRGDDGRFLEFTYDSDASYADDTNVLQTLNINPDTGAITQKNFTPSTKKIIDVYNEVDRDRTEWDAMAQQNLVEKIMADPNRSAGEFDEIISNPRIVGDNGTRRFDGTYNQAQDNTKVPVTYIALGVNATEEVLAMIDKEIKNQRMGTSMRNKASGTFYGDPNLSYGYNILLQGLSQKRNGTYHISSCTHSFSSRAGYQVVCDMYKVSDIPLGINTTETTTEYSDVKARAKSLKVKGLGDLQAMQDKYGYIPIEEIATDQFYPSSSKLKGTSKYYKALREKDANYLTTLGYTIYTVSCWTDKGFVTFKFRIPNNPKTGKSEVFGDILDRWDLYHVIPGREFGWSGVRVLDEQYVPPAKKKYE